MAAITLFWGLNWPAMKTVLDTLPVWTFRSICLVGGGLGLLMIARLTGRTLYLPPGRLAPLLRLRDFTYSGRPRRHYRLHHAALGGAAQPAVPG